MADTVGELFLDTLARFPERAFLRHRDRAGTERRWTYREGAATLAVMVRRLETLGLARGHRLLCFAEDMVPAVFMQLACAHLGVTTVFVSPLFSVDLLARLAVRLDSRYVFTTAEHADKLAGRDFIVETIEIGDGIDDAAAILGAA